MSLQAFQETDVLEAKVKAAGLDLLSSIGISLDDFYSDAYIGKSLGAVLWDSGRDPMAGPLNRESFLLAFVQIHQLFTRPGTFEFYLSVFRAIWGDDVDVEFTVPAPGKLEINIEALNASKDLFMARKIVDNAYVYDEVIDHESDNIVFQIPAGIKTQQEAEVLMKELYPAGLWVETTLTVT